MPFSVAADHPDVSNPIQHRPGPGHGQGVAPTKGSCGTCAARDRGLCSALDATEMPELASISQPRVVASGRPIAHEGAEAEAVFTVVSGMFKLYKSLADGRRQITGFATAGDAIGLARDGSYAYSAEAVTASTYCRVSRAGLETLMVRRPAVRTRLLAMASVELTAAQDQIVLLGCKRGEERLASFLLALARRSAGTEDDPRPTAFLPMQKSDIGGYLGLRPESVSRVFRRLEDAGLIQRLANDRVQILDPAGLGGLADTCG